MLVRKVLLTFTSKTRTGQRINNAHLNYVQCIEFYSFHVLCSIHIHKLQCRKCVTELLTFGRTTLYLRYYHKTNFLWQRKRTLTNCCIYLPLSSVMPHKHSLGQCQRFEIKKKKF